MLQAHGVVGDAPQDDLGLAAAAGVPQDVLMADEAIDIREMWPSMGVDERLDYALAKEKETGLSIMEIMGAMPIDNEAHS